MQSGMHERALTAEGLACFGCARAGQALQPPQLAHHDPPAAGRRAGAGGRHRDPGQRDPAPQAHTQRLPGRVHRAVHGAHHAGARARRAAPCREPSPAGVLCSITGAMCAARMQAGQILQTAQQAAAFLATSGCAGGAAAARACLPAHLMLPVGSEETKQGWQRGL